MLKKQFSGVAAGSAAAAWQSSIGSVAAGSMFAILQSLGATGSLGILLFGSVGAGLGLLGSSAAAIGWCTCENDAKNETKTEVKTETETGAEIESKTEDNNDVNNAAKKEISNDIGNEIKND